MSITAKHNMIEKYTVINNCPRCHGALFFVKDGFSHKKVIHCFQCGCDFKECKGIKKDNGDKGALMYIESLYRRKTNGEEETDTKDLESREAHEKWRNIFYSSRKDDLKE